MTFLPTIAIPNSLSSISLGIPALSSNASTRLVVSVVEIDKSLVSGSFNTAQNSSSAVSLPVSLRSDVLSVKVGVLSPTGSSLTPRLPSFVANMSLSGDTQQVAEAAVFMHNCTVGHVESVSYLCADSLVLFNLSCMGLSAVSMRRQCPVRQQVCSVLNLQTMSVLSTDYCSAYESSSGYVICRCGLNNNTNGATAILAAAGSLNMAVMTQYIAGDFGTFGGSGSLSASGFAVQSSAIFATCGCLWGFGMMLIVFHFSYRNKREITPSVTATVLEKRQHLLPIVVSPSADVSSQVPEIAVHEV